MISGTNGNIQPTTSECNVRATLDAALAAKTKKVAEKQIQSFFMDTYAVYQSVKIERCASATDIFPEHTC